MEPKDLDRFLPPSAPMDMPYQVLEPQRPAERPWLAFLRHLGAHHAPNE